jgi:hypothetical protein
MATVGFLSLLDASDAKKFDDEFQVRSLDHDLPPFLRKGTGSTAGLADVLEIRKPSTANQPTPREWDEFTRWLTDVVKAQPRTIERETAKKVVSARMCIFLAFYRQGIPINSIKASHISTDKGFVQQGRIAWPWAFWVEVPIMKQTTGLSSDFSNNWWLQKNYVALPTSMDYARVPKATVCHRLQTSQVVDPDKDQTQSERSEADRKRLALSLSGRSGESFSMVDLKEANSEWEMEAVEKFVAQMNLQTEGGEESCSSGSSRAQGMNLVEGYLKRRKHLGWAKFWYVLTGGVNVPGMLRYARAQY